MPARRRERDSTERPSGARGKAKRATTTALGGRIQSLIDRFYGSQRLAAKSWGTARATIDRIVNGEVAEPRGELLVRIAQACGTSTDWLLTGKGPAPQLPHDPSPSQIQEEWQQLVEGIGLDERTRDAMLLLPGRVRRAFAQLLVWDAISRHDETPFASRHLTARRQAEDRETEAWIDLLNLVLDRYGLAETRRVLQRNWLLLAIGFNSGTRLFLEYLTLHDRLNSDALAHGFETALKQCAMVFHPREMTPEEVQAAMDPFGAVNDAQDDGAPRASAR